MAIPVTGSYVFDSIVADPQATNPTSLNLTLNTNGVSANAENLGSVKAIVFNAASLNNSATQKTFIINGVSTKVKIDSAYNGATFGLILDDGSSYLVNVNTSTTEQTQSAFNGFDTVSTEKLRKWNLEG